MCTADECKELFKLQKAHERSIIGIAFYINPKNGHFLLLTLAHDSLKYWTVSAFENDLEVFEVNKIANWHCGIQSFDISRDGKSILLVSIDSTLREITFDEKNEPIVHELNNDLMEIWYARFTPTRENYLTTSFPGKLKEIDRNGKIIKSLAFDKIKLTSAITYSYDGKLIAIANSFGWVTIVNAETLVSLYLIEAHLMKIRTVAFLLDDKQILSGSDDKTIKLYNLQETKGVLARSFCGHSGAVLSVVVDESSGGERFASCSVDRKIILWDLTTGAKLHIFVNPPTDFFRTIAFSPNGKFLVGGTDDSFIFIYSIPQPENYIEPEYAIEQESLLENTAPDSLIENNYSNEFANNLSPIEDTIRSTQFTNIEEEFRIESPSTAAIQSPGIEEEINDILNNSEQFMNNTDHSTMNLSKQSYYDSNGTLQIVSQTMNSSNLEGSIDADKTPTPNINENDGHENEVGMEHNEDEVQAAESQEPVNFQDEFERQELEMQLGID